MINPKIFEKLLNSERKYLIWSIEHGAWWKLSGSGYTSVLAEAGVYCEYDAFVHCSAATILPPLNLLQEVPVPLEFAHFHMNLEAEKKLQRSEFQGSIAEPE